MQVEGASQGHQSNLCSMQESAIVITILQLFIYQLTYMRLEPGA